VSADAQILKVFNNNVVLARDASGHEVVLTGRGLGFQARAGQQVDPDKVTRVFQPAGTPDQESFAALLADIPPEHVELAAGALERAGVTSGSSETGKALGSLVVALADHLSFAVKRQRSGIVIEYPFRGEVAHLYPDEYAAAGRVLAEVNAGLDSPLPEAEAVAIALHLVNASFARTDLTSTQRMTELLQQVFSVLEASYGRTFETGSINAARFVTHLRYFFVRFERDRQLAEDKGDLGAAVRNAYPEAATCSARIRALLELRLGQPLTEDETTYLTLHVARLATDDRKDA
jgi:beta-glucoside operon transcriptional antiterminator